jgi:starch synthase
MMKILFASSEAVPFAKTGGLADVSGALPRALSELGHEVTLFLPKYRQIDERKHRLIKTGMTLRVPVSQRVETAEIYAAELSPRLRAYFLDQESYYNRDQLYGTPSGDFEDNAERFTFFSRAIAEAALELKPDIIHCNDWQTGLTPVYLKTLYRNVSLLQGAVSIFTIHNIGYQGLFWHYDIHLTNLGWEVFTPKGLEFYGKLNFLKGGIVFADVVTTVSRKYRDEIQTAEYGAGLEGVLQERQADLYGILNGVDYEEWDPARDLFIKERYHPGNLSGKKACKKDLQREFGFAEAAEIPLIGIISRFTDQKGFDLIAAAIEPLMELDVQLAILGTGEEKYHLLMEEIATKYPAQAGVRIAFDNPLAHRIEAGADMFLMPSRYEPCGLNQIYSLKYGTVPIVRATGGLDDTIENFDPVTGEGNGFKFQDYSPGELLTTVEQAIRLYRDPILWEKLMLQGMAADFSWQKSARAYENLYEHVLLKKRAAAR